MTEGTGAARGASHGEVKPSLSHPLCAASIGVDTMAGSPQEAAAQRLQYVEYLEACARQRRRPAEEVVEMAGLLEREHSPLPSEAAVVTRQQILELQLGLKQPNSMLTGRRHR